MEPHLEVLLAVHQAGSFLEEALEVEHLIQEVACLVVLLVALLEEAFPVVVL